MSDPSLDPRIAAAETKLDRIDDADDASEQPAEIDIAAIEAEDGLHIEEAGLALTSEEIEELDPASVPDGEETDCIDTFAEAFNARDLDGLLDLVSADCETPGLGNDIDNFPEAIEDLWDRRPSCTLTRGLCDDQVVGVMWEFGDGSRWWPVATVHVDDVVDGQIGVVEFSDDPSLLERVEGSTPDLDLDEGSRWEEWDEGASPDG